MARTPRLLTDLPCHLDLLVRSTRGTNVRGGNHRPRGTYETNPHKLARGAAVGHPVFPCSRVESGTFVGCLGNREYELGSTAAGLTRAIRRMNELWREFQAEVVCGFEDGLQRKLTVLDVAETLQDLAALPITTPKRSKATGRTSTAFASAVNTASATCAPSRPGRQRGCRT